MAPSNPLTLSQITQLKEKAETRSSCMALASLTGLIAGIAGFLLSGHAGGFANLVSIFGFCLVFGVGLLGPNTKLTAKAKYEEASVKECMQLLSYAADAELKAYVVQVTTDGRKLTRQEVRTWLDYLEQKAEQTSSTDLYRQLLA